MERNLPIPDPGHREILVKVEAVGVCASDGKCYSGAEVYWGKPGGLKLIFKKKKKEKNGNFYNAYHRALKSNSRFCNPLLTTQGIILDHTCLKNG